MSSSWLVFEVLCLRGTNGKMSSGNVKIGQPAPNFKAMVVNARWPVQRYQHIWLQRKLYSVLLLPSSFHLCVPPQRSLLSMTGQKNLRNPTAKLIGASADSHFYCLAQINTLKKQGGLGPTNNPLVSDPKHTITQDYGVLDGDGDILFRDLFTTDDKCILQQSLWMSTRGPVCGRDSWAFQLTEKHGEVCPTGWKPDVQKSKEYFSKQK